MSALTMLFLKRVAMAALLLSAVLLLAPRLLREAGVLGPDAGQAIRAAEGSLEGARTYGGTSTIPSYAVAERQLAEARTLLGQGDERAARATAQRANENAIAAQRDALVAQTTARTKAAQLVEQLDREVNDLERLYAATAPTVDKATAAQFLTTLKNARRTAAALDLAQEQENWTKVLEQEPAARAVLQGAREKMMTARPAVTRP